MGVSFWSYLIAGLVCCDCALAAGRSFRVGRKEIGLLLARALVVGTSGVVLFEAAGRVSAVLFLPIAMAQGHFFVVGAALSLSDALIVMIGLCDGVCTVL